MSQWEEFDAWYAEHGWKYVSSREGAFVVWKAAADTLRQSVAELEMELNEVRNAEREKCAALCEKSDRYRGDYFAAKIRAMGDE